MADVRVVLHQAEIRRVGTHNREVQDRKRREAERGAQIAAQLAPKLTGAGAASIHAEELPDGNWAFSWDQEHDYMQYQELGTEHHGAQPFLRPAAKRLES